MRQLIRIQTFIYVILIQLTPFICTRISLNTKLKTLVNNLMHTPVYTLYSRTLYSFVKQHVAFITPRKLQDYIH